MSEMSFRPDVDYGRHSARLVVWKSGRYTGRHRKWPRRQLATIAQLKADSRIASLRYGLHAQIDGHSRDASGYAGRHRLPINAEPAR
jgi:hypothetical protein